MLVKILGASKYANTGTLSNVSPEAGRVQLDQKLLKVIQMLLG